MGPIHSAPTDIAAEPLPPLRPRAPITDDDEYDDRDIAPSATRRRAERARAPGSKKALVIALSVGGGVLAILVIGLIVVLATRGSLGPQPVLVGRWEKQGGLQGERLEFLPDGTLVMEVVVLRLQKKYRVLDATTLEVEETMFKDIVGKLQAQGLPVQDNFDQLMKQQVRFQIQGDLLTFSPNGAGLAGTYRRMP